MKRAPELLWLSWVVACTGSEPAGSPPSHAADAKPVASAKVEADGDGAVAKLEAPPKIEPADPGPAFENKPPPPEDPPSDAPTKEDPPEATDTGGGTGDANAEAPVPELTVTAVSATDATAPWREVVRPADAVVFEPVMRGVIGSSPSGYYDVDDAGALVLRKEIEAPQSVLMGWWPDNAWHIETRIKTIPGDRSDEEIRQIRLMRLRGNKRWVPQEYNFAQRFDDNGEQFHIGGKGGMLVMDAYGSVTRVAGTAPDPEIGESKGGTLTGFFETKSGRLYTVHEVDGAQWVQTDCVDQACVAANAIKLPLGTYWEFSGSVPRQNHSVSAVATAQVHGNAEPHLLHYETGGWKLESVTAAPVALWPTKDGGLWTRVADDLLHRDPDGAWRKVGLPEGTSTYSVALRGDLSELWIAADVGGKTVVYATHANAQSRPPEPSAAG